MASHQENMYFDGVNTHPFNPMTLNRQAPRPFDNYGQLPAMYPADRQAEDGYRYATQSQRRSPQAGGFNTGWNYNPNVHAATMSNISGVRPPAVRAPIPSPWMEQGGQFSPLPMPSGQMMPFTNAPPASQYAQSQRAPVDQDEDDEELIPTAIVIKNIPFALHKDSLCEIMVSEGLPLPYAFNYHFEGGTFRGLAFANYSSQEETAMVIDKMDGFQVHGRRLRVEYKKMLPARERARIEREKREKRGQLEEQHRAGAAALTEQYRATLGPLRNQPSMSSIASGYPANSPPSPSSAISGQSVGKKIDMNDPDALLINDELLKFQLNDKLQVWEMGTSQSHKIRSIIHELAERRGLRHRSSGSGENRYVTVHKERHDFSTMQVSSLSFNESRNRGLARAATTDFAESRESKFNNLRKQSSALLDIPHSPGSVGGVGGSRSLREAKSFSDIQVRAGSPFGNSTQSFPPELRSNLSRYTDYGLNGGQSSNATNGGLSMTGRDDTNLSNGFANMSLAFDRTMTSSRINGRTMNNDGPATAGAIGSQRSLNGLNGANGANGSTVNGNHDDAPRTGVATAPERQPRGPGSEWGPGFTRPRQNGHTQRGSGDLDINEQDQTSSATQPSARHL